jgi:hypothetical protein
MISVDILPLVYPHMLEYEVRSVDDGVEAEQAYKASLDEQSSYDIVITDLTKPGGMGGRETMISRLLEAAFLTGLRANELRNLTVDDLDHEECGLHLRAHLDEKSPGGFQPLPRSLVDCPAPSVGGIGVLRPQRCPLTAPKEPIRSLRVCFHESRRTNVL